MHLSVNQNPRPGNQLIYREGDFILIELTLSTEIKGKAYLRTNLFSPEKKRLETIDKAEANIPRRYQEWGDFAMTRKNPGSYYIELPLTSIGYFEAKACFIPDEGNEPVWPEGKNIFIKVEPAETTIGNSIYCAFVRLFMEEETITKINDSLKHYSSEKDKLTIIPESGKFRNLISKLDFIIDELGFDIIMLLPIHPVPTTYARMGLFGSPYASLDFYNVDPALAEFDEKTTPIQQFTELTDAVHAKSARLFMDIPANHTGWASQLQVHHPGYFIKDNKGRFISPGAWGITWSDLSELDYSKKGLWKYMADVFLFWCEKGVDGFRCDAGYMIPEKAWKYIISKVRIQYPETIFLLEGLGGKKETTENLLTESNLNWAYSEMFQNYNQEEMDWYISEFSEISLKKGPLVNFSETHDNERLASVSKAFSRLRNGLTALLSDTGTFAITCGVEWFADEKIDVHRLTSMNWGNEANQAEFIKLLNNILKTHPGFQSGTRITKMHTSFNNSIAYLREPVQSRDKLAIVANLSDTENNVYIDKEMGSHFLKTHIDLITGDEIKLKDNERDYIIGLNPYQIIALTNNDNYLQTIAKDKIGEHSKKIKSERALKKQLIALFEPFQDNLSEKFIESKMQEFKENPYRFFFSNFEERPPVIKWLYPQDAKREVTIPDGTPLLIQSSHKFRYKLQNQNYSIISGESYHLEDEYFVSIIPPKLFEKANPEFQIQLEIIQEREIIKETGHLLVARKEELFNNKNKFGQSDIHNNKTLLSLAVNNKSGISSLRGAFSNIQSKYDGMISANMNEKFPEDRQIMLTRIRGWTMYKGFSRAITEEYQKSFEHYQNTTEYYFEMPVGGGLHAPITMTFKFDESENLLTTQIKRLNKTDISAPPADQAVTIIIRPDIENRNHHELTKAFTGAEQKWPKNTEHHEKGFNFGDKDKVLIIDIENGNFTREDEWQYMVPHPVEKERGMDGDSDLFSPGYFSISLKANEETTIYAAAGLQKSIKHLTGLRYKLKSDIKFLPEIHDIGKVLKRSIRKFIVERNSNKTVIAGYPWFTDWGRDTLICLRGIISAGFKNEAKSIIKEFASFEKEGTLPNLIRGGDTSNRDTSDAPLWLFVAVDGLLKQEKDIVNDMDCNGRTLKEVLRSIAEHYINETPNGIKMDPESALIYSPTHYTWMDTNHPAGTPREGYPIEIQALWFHALKLLSSLFPDEKQWEDLYKKVQHSIRYYFLINNKTSRQVPKTQMYLSDCLHTKGFQPAREAAPDDHLRPNQLFAITFEAINDVNICGEILSSCEELLIPGAIRTLADRETEYELPIYHQNKLVNNPSHPYAGRYSGNEDSSRKPAYHNGTAWTWPFPSYCEALVKIYGEKAYSRASDILSTSIKLFNSGCINQLPEILDGNYPHLQKGCYAQGWSITEFYRVAKLLKIFT
ncbi:MAG: amylo-alpha-1,6-glucosidase [Bacteroidota bacterium]